MEDVRFLEELYEVVKKNKGMDYSSVIKERASYAYLYHLSEQRENLVDWIPVKGLRVLECNPECGALTGKLLASAAEVTCVVEDELHAGIIRARYGLQEASPDSGQAEKEKSRLRIVLREAWDAQNEKPYDVILIVGSFYRYTKDLAMLGSLLAEDGRLYIADANRIGMKYLAGCQEEYRGGYFTGVEGYQRSDATEGGPDGEHSGAAGAGKCPADEREAGRCYTRGEYGKLLEEAGLRQQEIYYPYPDHKFPTNIYSDAWLPKKGELADNRRNFDRDRIALFDERWAYDTWITEGFFGEISNSLLIVAGKYAAEAGERAIYVRYSNERAVPFVIRTDITEDTSGEKKVFKYALRPESDRHIGHIMSSGEKLNAAYHDSGLSFCECTEILAGERRCVKFPFLKGKSLQDSLEDAAGTGDRAAVEELLREYIRRVSAFGGAEPFVVTEAFTEVFGQQTPVSGMVCAKVSDVDMIFSNILLEGASRPAEAKWQVIDYEWTFDFPVPKAFILYRALYFAYHQILCHYGWNLTELLAMADITAEQAKLFGDMEMHFQEYLGKGALPVRNMQRRMGTKILPLTQLLSGQNDTETEGGAPDRAKKHLWVRRILYHIDRQERQDGCMICSGWACARTWDGGGYPVKIRVTGPDGKELAAEISRRDRKDVADALKIQNAGDLEWGFDCVWIIPPAEGWKIHFSLGNREVVYPG